MLFLLFKKVIVNSILIKMKTKHLLFALAAPMFVVACTNEELVENSTIVQNLGEEISTEGLVLRPGFGANSRMSFDGTALKWILGKGDAAASTDALGLCLNLNGTVYTNYEFKVNALSSNAGNKYTVAGSAFSPAAPKEGDDDVTIEGDIATAPNADFVTENATIFGGSYVAYYPYSKEFKENATTIPVKVETMQEATGFDSYEYVGNYAFYVSDPFEMKGGQTEADFTMRQVLPMLQFNLTNKTEDATLKVSKIEVSVEGGMPVSGEIDANLTAFTEANLKVNAADKADSQLLTFATGADLNKTATEASKAFMIVMPGTYKNMVVKVVMQDGSYYQKTIESVTLKRNDIQPIKLEINDLKQGDVYGQVTSAAEFQTAIKQAALESKLNTVEITVAKAISGAASNIFGSSDLQMKGANVIVKGEKITVTEAYAGTQKLNNVTFENEVEFKGIFTGADNTKLTFKGKTKFNNKVTVNGTLNLEGNVELAGTTAVNDEAVLNIAAGTTTAKGNVTVGSATANPAELNIAEGATLNVTDATLATANDAAHTINVEGVLNLNKNNTTGATMSAANASNEVIISGEVNVANGCTLNITEGLWYVADGKITNNGTLTAVSGKVQDLGRNEEPMTLVNNGTISVEKDDNAWYGENINITNNGVYKLTEVQNDDIDDIVKNEDNAYPYVNAIESSLANSDELTIDEATADMSKYDITFDINATSANSSTIKIPANVTWEVKSLKLNITDDNTGTVTIKPADTTADAGFVANSVTVSGTDATKATLKFDLNTSKVVANLGTLKLTKATLDASEYNVTYKLDASSSNYSIKNRTE